MKRVILIIVVVLTSLLANAQNTAEYNQDSLLTSIAQKNLSTFIVNNDVFSGNGWDTLVAKIKASNFVLIGEQHLTNEIPLFVKSITEKVRFDNFFCEIDPYSAKIIESKIKDLSETQLKQYTDELGSCFSFFALEPEFNLLKKLVKSKTNVYGLDQIMIVADRLICHELKLITRNKRAKQIYEDIEEKSYKGLISYITDPSNPMALYLLSDEFQKYITELKSLNLSSKENEIIQNIELTIKIYVEQDNYSLRGALMKNNFMKEFEKMENKKNLFKFGALHMLKDNDIGNLVSNNDESKSKKALHIMILGLSGATSGPLKGLPNNEDAGNNEYSEVLKPIFNVASSKEWSCIDMLSIKSALVQGKIKVSDPTLVSIINGYDYLVLIPKVTAPGFIGSK
jgi:hypothetical protein